VARAATDVVPQKDGMLNLLDWFCGVVMIYAFLFGTGKIIFGETLTGLVFLAVGAGFGALIYRDLARRSADIIGT
jgi:hypothetical protein